MTVLARDAVKALPVLMKALRDLAAGNQRVKVPVNR
jgi:hypothetical protein